MLEPEVHSMFIPCKIQQGITFVFDNLVGAYVMHTSKFSCFCFPQNTQENIKKKGPFSSWHKICMQSEKKYNSFC